MTSDLIKRLREEHLRVGDFINEPQGPSPEQPAVRDYRYALHAVWQPLSALVSEAATELERVGREGWVLVPCEPTGAMVAAGIDADPLFVVSEQSDSVRAVFRAMIAASLPPPVDREGWADEEGDREVQSRRKGDVMSEACPNCDGEGWVCEEHPDAAWNDAHQARCGGCGMPCHICNPCTESIPPRLPPGFEDEDAQP